MYLIYIHTYRYIYIYKLYTGIYMPLHIYEQTKVTGIRFVNELYGFAHLCKQCKKWCRSFKRT